MNSSDPQGAQFDVRYGQQPTLYASQFLLSAGVEALILDCSSGIDAQLSTAPVVPVHTRLALSWGAVERLTSLLQQALNQRRKNVPDANSAPVGAASLDDAAKLPSVGNTHA